MLHPTTGGGATLSLLLLLLGVLLAPETGARKIYQDYIPNGHSFKNHPSLGHVAARARPSNHRLNQFGRDFKQAEYVWTENLCKTDSDGDGRTNGEELGDPDCKWFRGDPDPNPGNGWVPTQPGAWDDFSQFNFSVTSKPKQPPPQPLVDDRDDYEAGVEETQTAFDSGLPTWVVFHAIFMFLSFGLILPIATLFPYYLRHRRNWREEHLRMMGVSTCIALLGFIIAAASTSSGGGGSVHAYFGWLLMFAALMQGALGLLRKRIAFRFSRESWVKAHSRLGRGVLAFAALQLLLGYLLLSDWAGGNVGLVVWGVIHFALLGAALFAAQLKLKMRQFEPAEAMGEEEDLGFSELPPVTTGQ